MSALRPHFGRPLPREVTLLNHLVKWLPVGLTQPSPLDMVRLQEDPLTSKTNHPAQLDVVMRKNSEIPKGSINEHKHDSSGINTGTIRRKYVAGLTMEACLSVQQS